MFNNIGGGESISIIVDKTTAMTVPGESLQEGYFVVMHHHRKSCIPGVPTNWLEEDNWVDNLSE